MKLRLSEIPKDGIDMEFTMDESSLRRHEGVFIIREPIMARLHVSKSGAEIDTRCKIDGTVELSCVKCLSLFSYPLGLQFSSHHIPHSGFSSGERELKASELDVSFYKGGEIDLEEIVIEQLLLYLPPYPRCKEDCRGLCPKCGTNLNIEECGCRK